MHHQVQRKVERGNRPDHPDRHPHRETDLADSARRRFERNRLSRQSSGFGRRKTQSADSSFDFDAGRTNRLGGFACDDPREFLAVILEGPRRSLENGNSFVLDETSAQAFPGRLHRSIHVARGTRRNDSHLRTVERRHDLERVRRVARPRFTSESKGPDGSVDGFET